MKVKKLLNVVVCVSLFLAPVFISPAFSLKQARKIIINNKKLEKYLQETSLQRTHEDLYQELRGCLSEYEKLKQRPVAEVRLETVESLFIKFVL